VHPKNFPLLFGGVAVFAVVLSTLNRGIVAPPLSADAMAQERLAYSRERRPILVTFIIAYVLYTAAETSTSGWIASQLHREGFATSVGSLATGGFWLAMAFGRSMGGPLYKRFSDKSLVLAGLASCIVLSVAAYSHSVAPYVYPLIGLVLASVYPMGLIWYTVLCPHDSNGLALIILFLMGGGIIGPAVESLMVATYGIHAVPLSSRPSRFSTYWPSATRCATTTRYHGLRRSESLLVALDNAFGSQAFVVGIETGAATRTASAQQVPTLVELDLNRAKSRQLLLGKWLKLVGFLETLFLFSEVAHLLQDNAVIHGLILFSTGAVLDSRAETDVAIRVALTHDRRQRSLANTTSAARTSDAIERKIIA